MVNFFKGILGGVGNIIPGLSGSALLVIVGLYQKCINAITEIVKFKNLKKNILFLIPIGLGVVVGTVVIGNVLVYVLDKFPMQTSYAFLGFIVGTIPMLFKEANKKGFKKSYIIPLAIAIAAGFSLLLLKNSSAVQDLELHFIEKMILGFILAGSTIIPGISSTVLLSMIGYYEFYLVAVAKVDVIALLPVMIGLGIGAIMFAFLIKVLLDKHYGYTYYAISGFCIATIPAVIRGSFGFNLVTLISCLLAVIAFALTYYTSKQSKKQ